MSEIGEEFLDSFEDKHAASDYRFAAAATLKALGMTPKYQVGIRFNGGTGMWEVLLYVEQSEEGRHP